ncbi:hypothetical protein BDW72DRAFT_29160 [Aspergillus terricola var. indicus]
MIRNFLPGRLVRRYLEGRISTGLGIDSEAQLSSARGCGVRFGCAYAVVAFVRQDYFHQGTLTVNVVCRYIRGRDWISGSGNRALWICLGTHLRRNWCCYCPVCTVVLTIPGLAVFASFNARTSRVRYMMDTRSEALAHAAKRA